MSDLLFRCEDCKSFVPAGGRWAYLMLEKPRIIQADDLADGGTTIPLMAAEAVLAADAYWRGPAHDDGDRGRIAAQLVLARGFLLAHRDHRLSFGGTRRLHLTASDWLDWLCEDQRFRLMPRFLVERLGLRTWAEVRDFMEQQRSPAYWWEVPDFRREARLRFEALVAAARTNPVPPGRGLPARETGTPPGS